MPTLLAPGALPIRSLTMPPASAAAVADASSAKGPDIQLGRLSPDSPKKSASFTDDLQRALKSLPVLAQLQANSPRTKSPPSYHCMPSPGDLPNQAVLAAAGATASQALDQLTDALATQTFVALSSPSPTSLPRETIAVTVQPITPWEPELVSKISAAPAPVPLPVDNDVRLPAIATPARSDTHAAQPVLPPQNGTQAGLTPASAPRSQAPAPLSPAAGLASKLVSGARQAASAARPLAEKASARVALPSLKAPSSAQQESGSQRAPLPRALIATTPAHVDFIDPVNPAEEKGRSERNDSARAKENSTRPGPDAVNNNASVSARTTSTASKAPPQEPQITDQLSEPIVARSELVLREGYAEFRLQLDPPELGSVRVQLMATESGISVRLFVHDPSARQLIQSQLESLRQRLKQEGILVGGFDVVGSDAGSASQRHSRSEGEIGNPDAGSNFKATRPARKTGSSASRAVDVVV